MTDNFSSEPASWSERRRNRRVRSSRGRSSTSAGHALLDDPALVHEDEPVADLARELHLVRDDEHRHPVTGQIAHHDQHLADELRIERGGDLVEEHHVRLHHQRPRDRDPLLLAAGELVRMLAGLLRQPDLLEQLRARASAVARGRCAGSGARRG